MTKNKKKIRFRKKVFYSLLCKEINAIWDSIRELYKRMNEKKGDIPATISLKDLDNGLWELTVKAINDDQYCNIKGNLSTILHMGEVFRRIYDWDKKEEDKDLIQEIEKENNKKEV